MSEMSSGTVREELDSLLGWWELAGVDLDYSTEAEGWLDKEDVKEAVRTAAAGHDNMQSAAVTKTATVQQKQGKIESQKVNLPVPPDAYPEFTRFWMENPQLSLPSGTGTRIAPHGPLKPRLMIISDMPDRDDLQTLFSGVSGKLLGRILTTAGIAQTDVYHASLLPEHSLENRLDASILQAYRSILNKHIALVAPQAVILLGNMPNSALTGNDLPKNRLNLQFINHETGNIPAASSFHPRTLMQRPGLKAKAWQDWQWLIESVKQ
ncbi:uracil-DNA glycosylase family protein [Sphingorhabdus sp. Alg239-R122]|uniref:uracil-DNA glycosylase family protein n=1 Tax=Sphingorhabdus sp. Alg239-R122 TaxID=2305989 RepID=UPI0013DBF016|nr:uracil-DNA glycosylase family protein [Sphingorhabdus sp. Alg239-R122]